METPSRHVSKCSQVAQLWLGALRNHLVLVSLPIAFTTFSGYKKDIWEGGSR